MRSLAIVLMLSAFSGVALAQFKCENHTLPDGTTCPVDDNTDHTYPDEDHCSRYWDCYNGCFTHMQCQLNYLYDITTGWCDEPEKVYCGDRDCDGRPCKDDPPVPCNFDCEANGGDGFYPYKDNCIKFVECSNGQAICRTCRKENGQQLYYDPSKEWCNWRDQVDCDVRPECDENDQNCKDPHHTTTPKPTKCDSIECDHGDDFYPEGPCEQCFCQCHSGVQDEVCCPPGLVFNTALNICDYPANTNGC